MRKRERFVCSAPATHAAFGSRRRHSRPRDHNFPLLFFGGALIGAKQYTKATQGHFWPSAMIAAMANPQKWAGVAFSHWPLSVTRLRPGQRRSSRPSPRSAAIHSATAVAMPSRLSRERSARVQSLPRYGGSSGRLSVAAARQHSHYSVRQFRPNGTLMNVHNLESMFEGIANGTA